MGLQRSRKVYVIDGHAQEQQRKERRFRLRRCRLPVELLWREERRSTGLQREILLFRFRAADCHAEIEQAQFTEPSEKPSAPPDPVLAPTLLVHLAGYRCVASGVVNMFPHTAHVESMAVFERTA